MAQLRPECRVAAAPGLPGFAIGDIVIKGPSGNAGREGPHMELVAMALAVIAVASLLGVALPTWVTGDRSGEAQAPDQRKLAPCRGS